MTFSETAWRVIGASVTGTSHLHTGRGCDDAHAYRVHEHELLLMAAADGAGSAVRSALGAEVAVQAALDTAEYILNQQIEPASYDEWLSVLRLILTAAHDGLEQLAGEASVAPDFTESEPENSTVLSDYATTLLIAIVTAQWLACVQIGDGAIVIQQATGSATSLTPRHNGGYINETSFLTESCYLSEAHYTLLPRDDIQGIALLTDGLQLLAMNFPENTPHQPFFTPLFKFAASPEATAEELEQFLASERICSRTDDDKTLVLAVNT